MAEKSKLKTLNDEWVEYRNAAYPEGLASLQAAECHQAFFAGAFTAILNMMQRANLPEGQDEAAVKQLLDEAYHICQDRLIKPRI